ncbi:MAG: hypothetical protein ABEJ82_08505 [Haloplanus sp.]
MTRDSTISRRDILASIGAVGLLAGGPRVARALRGEPPFTRYTYAQTTESGPDLRVAWYERYNGVVVEESNALTGGPALDNTSDSFNDSGDAGRFVDRTGPDAVDAGPVLSIPNAQPGDDGLLVVGLRAEDADARVWLAVTASEFAENGVNEPESKDDDTTPDVGELQEYVEVEWWYDTGRLGVGACNGVRDPTEEAVVPAGTLVEVSDALAGGTLLDFGLVESVCIPAGSQRCLALRWRIDPSVTNVIQSDSARLDIAFAATTCDDDANPFEGAL